MAGKATGRFLKVREVALWIVLFFLGAIVTVISDLFKLSPVVVFFGLALAIGFFALQRGRSVALALGSLRLEIGPDQLRESSAAAARRAGYSEEQVAKLLETLNSKFAEGARIVINENLEAHFESVTASIKLAQVDPTKLVDLVCLQPVVDQLLEVPGGVHPLPPGRTPRLDRPGDFVKESGIYDLVDVNGTYLNHQEALVEGDPFPVPRTDPRARGYVLRHKALHLRPAAKTFMPGEIVPWSGIYDVVDDQGKRKGHQKTCVAGHRFPPTMPAGVHGYGYVLCEPAAFMAAIHLPGDLVPSSGRYDVVDHSGISLGFRQAFDDGQAFPALPAAAGELAYGFIGPL